jgi:hypothetical protein
VFRVLRLKESNSRKLAPSKVCPPAGTMILISG